MTCPPNRGNPRLYYRSRSNQEWECWAMFDGRLKMVETHVEPIIIPDSDVAEAASLLHLSIECDNGSIIRY